MGRAIFTGIFHQITQQFHQITFIAVKLCPILHSVIDLYRLVCIDFVEHFGYALYQRFNQYRLGGQPPFGFNRTC